MQALRAALDHEPTRRQRLLLRGSTALLVVSATVWVAFFAGFTDLHVYRTAGRVWFGDVGLYSDAFRELVPGAPLPFIYPPFAAVLFTPLAIVPWHVAKVLLTATSMAAVVVTTTVVAGRRYGRTPRAAVLALGVAGMWFVFEPVRQTIGFGQVNLVLMGLVTVDCLAPRVRWPRGLLLGLAVAIKLTPAVFVLFFLLRRQYRPALVSAVSFAGATLLGFAIAPGASVRYWFSVLLAPGDSVGITYAYNQSMEAVLARLPVDGSARFMVWAALVLVTLAVAVVGAYRARCGGDDLTALLLIAVWGLLASPISWSHHWVWVLPGAVLLYSVFRGGRTRAVVAVGILLVFLMGAHAYLPQTNGAELHWTWWQHLIGSSYVVAGLALLVYLAARPLTPAAQPVDSSPTGVRPGTAGTRARSLGVSGR